MMRQAAIILASLYLGAGLHGGLIMAAVTPTMNALGVAYYVATWPGQIYCSVGAAGCNLWPRPEVSQYFFDFDDAEAAQ